MSSRNGKLLRTSTTHLRGRLNIYPVPSNMKILNRPKNYERKIIRWTARNFLAEMSLASRIANKFGNFVVG